MSSGKAQCYQSTTAACNQMHLNICSLHHVVGTACPRYKQSYYTHCGMFIGERDSVFKSLQYIK